MYMRVDCQFNLKYPPYFSRGGSGRGGGAGGQVVTWRVPEI